VQSLDVIHDYEYRLIELLTAAVIFYILVCFLFCIKANVVCLGRVLIPGINYNVWHG
jgi:hypothetical protein